MKKRILVRVFVLLLFELIFFIRFKYINIDYQGVLGYKIPEYAEEQYLLMDLMWYFFFAYMLCALLELYLLPKFDRRAEAKKEA